MAWTSATGPAGGGGVCRQQEGLVPRVCAAPGPQEEEQPKHGVGGLDLVTQVHRLPNSIINFLCSLILR